MEGLHHFPSPSSPSPFLPLSASFPVSLLPPHSLPSPSLPLSPSFTVSLLPPHSHNPSLLPPHSHDPSLLPPQSLPSPLPTSSPAFPLCILSSFIPSPQCINYTVTQLTSSWPASLDSKLTALLTNCNTCQVHIRVLFYYRY